MSTPTRVLAALCAQSTRSPVPPRAPRCAPRCTRIVRAAGANEAADDAAEDYAFEGSILQDVRKGQGGFATTMRVAGTESASASVAAKPVVGDIVRISFGVETADGEVLQDVDGAEAVTFEVGASDVMGNPLFKAFDEAVRKLDVGASATVAASGGEYDPNLLFAVPSGHEEILRLRAEWADRGGFVEGLTVTLANGEPAIIRAIDDTKVMLDANHPFAGSDVLFKVRLLGVNDEEDVASA